MVYGRCSLLMHWSFASRNTGNQRRLLYVYINAVGKYRVKLSAMTNMLETTQAIASRPIHRINVLFM